MPLRFSHDEIHDDPEFIAETRQMYQDFDWFCEHAPELGERFPGLYVAITQGEVYAAATRLEAYNLAKEQKPGFEPLVVYIPKERRIMIYDLSWRLRRSEGSESTLILPLMSNQPLAGGSDSRSSSIPAPMQHFWIKAVWNRLALIRRRLSRLMPVASAAWHRIRKLGEPTLHGAASSTLAGFFFTPSTRSRARLFPAASPTLMAYLQTMLEGGPYDSTSSALADFTKPCSRLSPGPGQQRDSLGTRVFIHFG